MLQDATNRLGTVVDLNINDFLIMLEEEGIEPVVGCLEVIPKRPAPLEGELKREESSRALQFAGPPPLKVTGWWDG